MFEDKQRDDLITIEDLAEWLGRSKRTIENYRHHYPEDLPADVILPGRTVRYRVGTVRAWLDEQEKKRKRELGLIND